MNFIYLAFNYIMVNLSQLIKKLKGNKENDYRQRLKYTGFRGGSRILC